MLNQFDKLMYEIKQKKLAKHINKEERTCMLVARLDLMINQRLTLLIQQWSFKSKDKGQVEY